MYIIYVRVMLSKTRRENSNRWNVIIILVRFRPNPTSSMSKINDCIFVEPLPKPTISEWSSNRKPKNSVRITVIKRVPYSDSILYIPSV